MIVPRTKGAWRWGAGGAGTRRRRRRRRLGPDVLGIARESAIARGNPGASGRRGVPRRRNRPRGRDRGVGWIGRGGRVGVGDAGVGPRRLAPERVVEVRLAGVVIDVLLPHATVGGGERGAVRGRAGRRSRQRDEKGDQRDAARCRKRHRATREGRARSLQTGVDGHPQISVITTFRAPARRESAPTALLVFAFWTGVTPACAGRPADGR